MKSIAKPFSHKMFAVEVDYSKLGMFEKAFKEFCYSKFDDDSRQKTEQVSRTSLALAMKELLPLKGKDFMNYRNQAGVGSSRSTLFKPGYSGENTSTQIGLQNAAKTSKVAQGSDSIDISYTIPSDIVNKLTKSDTSYGGYGRDGDAFTSPFIQAQLNGIISWVKRKPIPLKSRQTARDFATSLLVKWLKQGYKPEVLKEDALRVSKSQYGSEAFKLHFGKQFKGVTSEAFTKHLIKSING